ncbi:MAG: hypothetical protein K0S83_1278, partial [Thermomicrobiales bacterium]|nr:hypothetical protein [Thermomicrobiales bacterium]
MRAEFCPYCDVARSQTLHAYDMHAPEDGNEQYDGPRDLHRVVDVRDSFPDQRRVLEVGNVVEIQIVAELESGEVDRTDQSPQPPGSAEQRDAQERP